MNQPKIMFLAMLVACGTNGDESPADAGPATDDAGHLLVDAAPTTPAAGYTSVPITCTDYVRTVTHTASDMTKDVTTDSWAFTTYTPGADFLIHTCSPMPTAPACNSGDTCVGSGQPPGATLCSVSRSGDFIDGKLALHCGIKTAHYLPNGTLNSSTNTNWMVSLEVRQ